MTTCVLFDLFGTLVEYEAALSQHDLTLAAGALAKRLDREVHAGELHDAWDRAFKVVEGQAANAGREFHMEEAGVLVARDFGLQEDVTEQLVAEFIDDWSSRIVPIPGAAGLLGRLAGHYRLGLITNTHYPPMVDELLARMDIAELFETVVMSVTFGRPKPDPAIFSHTLDKMALTASEVVYVGDSFENDYQGARAAGIDCYLIGNHARVPRQRQLRSILDLSIHFQTSRTQKR